MKKPRAGRGFGKIDRCLSELHTRHRRRNCTHPVTRSRPTIASIAHSLIVGICTTGVPPPPPPPHSVPEQTPAPTAKSVSAFPALSVSATCNGLPAPGSVNELCVAQQFASAEVRPSDNPAGVTVNGAETATPV